MAREYKDWEASSNREILQLRQDIPRLEQELEQGDLKRSQLSGNNLQRNMERLAAEEREANAALIGKRPQLEEHERAAQDLTTSLSKDEKILEALVSCNR